MKPHRLVIEGLRSYRSKTTIDFADAALFAIVGDTGSGKSSILEAIVYALYAATTWSKQPGELISDGVRTMTVELTFEVDGHRWCITRSMSRGGYPPPIHRLESLEDRTLRFDTAASVNSKVEQLIGLSYEAFCSAVILPQGHFERLLTETPGGRAGILKGIFRLEQLDAVRERARELGGDWTPHWEALRRERAGLLDDPLAAASAARERVATTDRALATISALQETLAEIARAADEDGRHGAALANEATALQTARQAVDPVEGGRLEALRDELTAEIGELREERDLAGEAEEAATAAVVAAKEAGEDAASLARLRQILESAERDLPALRTRRQECADELTALQAQEATWQTEQAALPGLAEARAQATTAATTARAAADAARRSADAAAGLLEKARRLVTQLDGARRTAADAAKEASDLAERSEIAAATQATAQHQRNTTERELEAARAHDAAATAAHGLHAGDSCPICARTLADGWTAPDAADLEAARRARDDAADELERARGEAVAAARAVDTAAERARTTATRADELRRELAEATDSVAGHLAGWAPDKDRPDALGPLLVVADAVEATADGAEAAKNEAARSETAEIARLDQTRKALDRRAETARRAMAQAEADGRRILDALSSLPGALAVTVAASTEDFERAFGRLETLEAADADRQLAAKTARDERRRLDNALDALKERLSSEAERPLSAYREHVSRLGAAAQRAKLTLGREPTAPDDVASVLVHADELARLLAAEMERCAAAVQAAGERRAALLDDHGFAGEAPVEERLRELTGERAVADRERTTAEGQIAAAVALDRRIAEGGALLDALRELVRLLGDAGFVHYIVEARQRALLGIASSILDDTSGGRYGFAADFEIVDRGSGQPRSARTLSGGETFQASLALALGLVELAGRSGGRLSSLFLDEGFGTLDANALDEALEELERRASNGRVIGVISHLRSVSDRLEHVLRVDKQQGRTYVRWIAGADLERMADEDVSQVGGLTH